MEFALSQYFWRPSLTVDSIVVSYLERGLVEHLEEPDIDLSLYGHLCSFDIQNKEARSDSTSLVLIPKEDRKF